MKTLAPFMLVIALLWHAYEGATQAYADSITLDEFPHYLGGLDHWTSGMARVNLEHPPLAKLVGTLPAKLKGLSAPSIPESGLGRDIDVAKSAHHLLIHEPDHREALWEGRILLLFFPLMGIVAVFALSWRMGGGTAAIFSTLMTAMDPNLLFHGHLITTDVPLMALILAGAWACVAHLERPRGLTLLALWLAVGSAILVKFNGLVALVYLAAVGLHRGRRGVIEAMGGLAFCWFLLGLAYGSGFASWLPSAYLEGLQYVGDHAAGRTVFLDGVAGAGSFPLHALASCVAKVPFWLMVTFVAGLLFGSLKRMTPLIVVSALCLCASLASPLNLGVRHSLPWMGCLWVISGVGVAQGLRNKRLVPLALMAVGGFVILVMLWSRWASQSMLGEGIWEMTGPLSPIALRVAPGLIMILVGLVALKWRIRGLVPMMALLPLTVLWMSPRGFAGFDSMMVGGGSRGFVTDSNLDWGQDLGRLGKKLDAHRVSKARVWLFGLDFIPTNANLIAFPASYDTFRFQGVSDEPMAPSEILVISEHVLGLPSTISRYSALGSLRRSIEGMQRLDVGLDSLRVYRQPPALIDSSPTHAR